MHSRAARIDAGVVSFTCQHRYVDGGAPHTQGAGSRGGNYPTQGMSIKVVAQVEGKETELLRFDCFATNAHYHYGPEKNNERVMLDPTVVGNPLGWTMKQLRTRLPAMLERAGYGELGSQLNPQLLVEKIDELECTAREMARTHHSTTTHNRGNPVIEAGNIRFGLEIRAVGQDGGPAIHVLGDVAGQEIELLAFDCFRVNPHYHYGPRNQDERIFHDKTLVPDSLAWVLTQFKSGKLPAMITRAGYPSIATAIDADLVAEKVREVETTLQEMAAAAAS